MIKDVPRHKMSGYILKTPIFWTGTMDEGRRWILMTLKKRKTFWIFLLPAMILIVVFLIYPLGKTFYYSFTDWKNFSVKMNFIGLKNYKRLFSDPVIRVSLRNTFIMMAGVILFQVVLSLILALMVSDTKHGFKFFRAVYFIPILISATAIGLMFRLIYGYEYGLLNMVREWFGAEPVVWITKESSIYLVSIPTMWQYVGFYFVVFLTGMTKIPVDIMDSAILDGITPFQKAVYITIPMIRDVIASAVILVISGCFKVFDMVYVITGGGPMNSSELLSTYMYSNAFRNYNGAYASAISIVMIVMGVVLSAIVGRVISPKDDYM